MFSFRQIASCVMLGAVVVPLTNHASAQANVWSFTMKIDTDSGGGTARRTSMAVKFQTSAEKYRSEYVQVTGEMGTIEGSYSIFNMADSTMTMIMPAQKMAMVTAVGPTLARGDIVVPKRGENHVTRHEVADVGAGERIAGYPTHRYRITTAGTTEWSMMGHSCIEPNNSETDLWITAGLDLGAAVGTLGDFSAYMEGSASDNGSAAKIPKGAVLRSTIRKQLTGADGSTRTISTTSEIVEMKKIAVDPSAFTVPAGYKIMDTQKMMAGMPAGMMDSLMQAQNEHTLARMCNGAPKH